MGGFSKGGSSVTALRRTSEYTHRRIFECMHKSLSIEDLLVLHYTVMTDTVHIKKHTHTQAAEREVIDGCGCVCLTCTHPPAHPSIHPSHARLASQRSARTGQSLVGGLALPADLR
mmetsp:Transcript_42616/g.106404  ORF Transcript_42616/g.106404 Transcript_42616/m.106404 type:complete len:116 (+) Transcript_42616:301-648(+)